MLKDFPPRAFIRLLCLAVSSAVGCLLLLIVHLADVSGQVQLPQGDQPAELYANQLRQDLRRTILTAIDGAHHSVVLAVYTLTEAKVIEALKRKAEAGVAVTVVVDAKASPKAKKQLGPLVATIRRSPQGLMHLKVLVIDESQVWIGSANMTFDSLRTHGNLIGAVDHPQLAQEIKGRLLSLPQSGQASPARPIGFSLAEQQGELWFLPSANRAVDRLVQLIDSAQKIVRVAMFTWTHPELTRAVLRAHRRGVQVEVVIDRRQGQGAGAETVYLLSGAGIPVSLSRGDGLLHHKMLLVDDEVLVNGSANWTRSAFCRNDDCFVILRPLNESQKAYLSDLWQVLQLESNRAPR